MSDTIAVSVIYIKIILCIKRERPHPSDCKQGNAKENRAFYIRSGRTDNQVAGKGDCLGRNLPLVNLCQRLIQVFHRINLPLA